MPAPVRFRRRGIAALIASTLILALAGCGGKVAPEGDLGIDLTGEAVPLPYPPRGLSFQMELLGAPGDTPYRPIGDEAFASDGSLLLTFPGRDLVARFAPPDYRPSFWGAETWGGGGQLVRNPARLFVRDDRLVFADQGGDLTTLATDGSLVDRRRTGAPGAIPLSAGSYLAMAPGNPWGRLLMDDAGQTRAEFLIPAESRFPGDAPQWIAGADGEVLAAEGNGTRLYHFDDAGNLRATWTLQWPEGIPILALKTMRAEKGAIWLLVHILGSGPTEAQLAVLDRRGRLRHFWSLPFAADGFAIAPDRIALVQRSLGAAQTHLREN